MSDIIESLGLFTKNEDTYCDLSKLRFPPMTIAISAMLLYFAFCLFKFPL